jgi:torsin-1
MFKRGIKSQYFKQFVATKDFPHNEKLNEYKDKIIRTIEDTVEKCHRSLFVFDEVDKIPIGLLDTIKAYVDFNQNINGLDFRNSVFVFLSNSASRSIVDLTLKLTQKNIDRNDFELKEFQEIIENQIYFYKEHDNKGLWHASLIESYLIDYYVPFLPLERSHVINCVETEFKKYSFQKKYSFTNDFNAIVNEIVYEPPEFQIFSTSGCKKIPFLVRKLIIEKDYKIKEEL